MACSSPFAYTSELTYYETKYTINFTGKTQIPGYTIPGVSICEPVYTCTETTCLGCVCNTWQWCSCCTSVCDAWALTWTDCWTTPSVTIWPTLNLTASLTIPMIFDLGAGFQITADAPTEPIQTASFTFEDFTFEINVNGVSVTIDVPVSLTITEKNGTFSTTIPITSITETFTTDGITYTITFSFSLYGCLTPTPPVGWLNIEIAGSLSAAGATTDFTILCPIISVED